MKAEQKLYKNFSIIVIVTSLLILLLANGSIWQKEQTLKNGRLVILELAPVDPRSLMQGDYMAINYQFVRQAEDQSLPKKGVLVFNQADNHVAKLYDIYDFKDYDFHNSKGKVAIRYKLKHGQPFIGSDTFFFQEGSAEKYQLAQYGGLIVDDKGQAILTHLYDKDLKKLQ